jgi:hypothetical protein
VDEIDLYNKLKLKINRILKSLNSNYNTYSVYYLSLIKAHPFYLKKYNIFFSKSKLKFLKVYFIEFFYFIKFFHYFFDKQIDFNERNITNLFVSHYMNKYQNLDSDPNFIFNDNSLSVYINHTHERNKFKIKKNTIILARRLKIIDEIKIIFSQIKERRRLLNLSRKKNDYFLRLIAADAISPATITNNRIAKQINDLTNHYKPKKFITTFEGYSWEKLIIWNANKKISKCTTFGYIPGLLLKNYGSNVIEYKSDYYPNKILVSGNYTKSKLNKMRHLKNKVVNLGTIKNFPIVYKLKKNNEKNILVIPEGILSEVDIFLEFINKCYKHIDQKFIIRFHPVIKNNKKYNVILKETPNIIVSKKDLSDDIKRSKFVLYRGSSLVVNCIKNRLIPIYLNSEQSKINIDPIYDMKNLVINNVNDLKKLLKSKKNIKKIRNLPFFSKYKSKFFD